MYTMEQQISITADSLHHKAVVSLDDGRKLGSVDDILFDPQAMRATGFVVNGERGESVLMFEQVKRIGDDAITVDNVSATQAGHSSLPGLLKLSKLKGLKVVDSAGTLVGELHDLEIDGVLGTIYSLEVRSGGVLGIGAQKHRLAVADVCSFGPGLITVSEGSHSSIA